jgi:type II secretory pathway component PulF
VAIVSALAGVIVVLLVTVAPWAKAKYEAKGIEPSEGALLVFQASRLVTEHLGLVLLLIVALIGLLWSTFGLLDRAAGP